jgi:ubiquinone biosynthesis protein
MILALVSEDFEKLCYEYAELGSAGTQVDFEGFQREVRNTLSPYMGLRMGEMNSGQILIEATKVASKYQIRIPGDWMLVFKAIFTMEGMAVSLDPEFDSLKLGQELAKDISTLGQSKDQIIKDFFWMGKDLLSLAEVLPRNLKWALKKWSADGYAFEMKVPELIELKESYKEESRRSRHATLSGGLFIAFAVSLQYSNDSHFVLGYPLTSILLLVSALYCWWRV